MSDPASQGVAQPVVSRTLVVPADFAIQAVDARVEREIPQATRDRIRARGRDRDGREDREGRDGRDGRDVRDGRDGRDGRGGRDDRDDRDDHSIFHPDRPRPRPRPGPGPSEPNLPPAPKPPQVPVPPIESPVGQDPFPNGALPGSLGKGLDKFVGTFEGAGLNMIFRPRNGFGQNFREDNLLEYDLTTEQLVFMDAAVLGDVPNRGFNQQEDVNLRGIPYTQMIKNHLNPATGKADLPKPVDIHFEQGLFMRTPALQVPAVGATISRMASIPHGTTINAQAPEPTEEVSGAPNIPIGGNIMKPFGVGADPVQGQVNTTLFDNLSFDNVTALRIPPDLSLFEKAGTITRATFENPNQLLKDTNAKKVIVKHVTFTVTTDRTPKLPGGGTANIAFLAEPEIIDPQTGKNSTFIAADNGTSRSNANAVKVTCTYWISTVQHIVEVPAWKPGPNTALPELSPIDTQPGVRAPKFKLELKKEVKKPIKIKVFSTQIQYSQNVTLDFGPLSWPHISVATLIPKDVLVVKAADLPAELK